MKQYLPNLQRDVLYGEESSFSAKSSSNPQVGPEKYISIEYETWLNKYKPMEQEIVKLKAALGKERNSKDGTLYIQTNMGWHGGAKHHIGTINFSVKDAPKIDIPNRVMIVDMVKDILRSFPASANFVEKEYLQEHLRKVEKKQQEIFAAEHRIEERLKNIGKFWRWLLKLK